MCYNETMKNSMITKLYFRLLPMQVLLVVIMALNGLVSGLFASNFIGADALSAVGLYNPVGFLVGAVSLVLLGGSQIMCGKFMANHKVNEMRSVFSLDILASLIFGALLGALLMVIVVSDCTPMFSPGNISEEVETAFEKYLIGQAIGLIPLILGQQLFAFISIEQQNKRSTAAIIISIVLNIILNYILICVLNMGTFGLALASAISNWGFMLILAQYFFTDRATLKFTTKGIRLGWLKDILMIGSPSALVQGYQMFRGLIVNSLVLTYVGEIGLSAFSASNSLLAIFWALPLGTQVVSRMLLSVADGEEDRRSLTDIMRTVIYKCIPLTLCMAAFISAMAVPFTGFFYDDPSQPVFQMTVNAFRILPLAMPFSVFCLSFDSYGQVSGKQFLVHSNVALDGVICVALFSAILIPVIGMDGLYAANVLNGVVTVLEFVLYSWIIKKHFPKNMDDLMVIPDDFGARDEDKLDISIQSIEEVLTTSQSVQEFCLAHGVDKKKSYYGALCLEEMAGNIVEHGFDKDKKKHTILVRVVYNPKSLLLRIKDDCVPFDPEEHRDIFDTSDACSNIGIRMVYKIADDIDYQYIFGLNVLTMKINVDSN